MTNGVEKIIQRIEEKAKKEEESILEEGKEKAEQKKLESERKAEKEKKRIIEKGKREADRISRRILANARKKARQKKLEVRDEIIQEVFARAKEQLGEMKENSADYKEVLKDIIIEAGLTVGGGDLEVLLLDDDKEMFSDSEIREISEQISKETGKDTSLEILAELSNRSGGAIGRKSDGKVSCNNTFEARLRRMKGSLRPKIADILFKD